MKSLTILGSTGSIGLSTLDVCRHHPDEYEVVALTANTDIDTLFDQVKEFRPKLAVVVDAQAAENLRNRMAAASISGTEIVSGSEALIEVAALAEVDMVMAAIVGAAGLLPALAAVEAGKTLLLANKEALVLSGHLFIETARRRGARILPIDSEHNAIYQCLPTGFEEDLRQHGVSRLLLTASGGPFLQTPAEQLSAVTPEQAVAHPNWEMGRKISVDSATMMNKGLEVIEARWLFNVSADDIEVVVHPQSVIHSLVQYVDGSVLAQMGNPDMRTPIAHAMAWPERIESGVAPLDLFDIARLDFEKPDFQRFPCLALAFESLRERYSAPAILNAANEVAVESFLQGQIKFTDIAAVNAAVMDKLPAEDVDEIEHLLQIDVHARDIATQFIQQGL